MPVLGYITYDDTKINDSNTPQGSVITALKPYSVYRNFKFYYPTTGDLKTWLEANAVKMPLEGTWVFNEKLTTATPPLRTDIAFTSNGTEFTNIHTGGGGLEPTKSYYLFYNDTNVNRDSAYTGNWVNQAYRAITFTQPVQYEGNEEFVRWFVDNAAPPPVT